MAKGPESAAPGGWVGALLHRLLVVRPGVSDAPGSVGAVSPLHLLLQSSRDKKQTFGSSCSDRPLHQWIKAPSAGCLQVGQEAVHGRTTWQRIKLNPGVSMTALQGVRAGQMTGYSPWVTFSRGV